MNGNNSLRSGNGNQDVTYPQTGAQNLVSEERIESETPYRAGKRSRNQDQDSSILGREESGARSPAVAQSFGEGGATTTRSFGERTLDQPWNEERTTGEDLNSWKCTLVWIKILGNVVEGSLF